jgi:hypothetical protein
MHLKKSIIMLCLFLVFSLSANAQLVAFVGKDSNSPDEFSFVALSEIPNATNIYFTNRDWDNTSGVFTGTKGTLLFTSSATILKGTVTQISETAANTFTVTGGSGNATIIDGSWSAFGADPHYAFSSNTPGDPLNNVTEVYSFLNTDTSDPQMNPTSGTNNSPNALVLDFNANPAIVAVDFNADRSTATKTELMNPANYLSGASITLDLTSFTSPTLPVELESFEVE